MAYSYLVVFQATSTGTAGFVVQSTSADPIETWYVDDASVKQITNAALADGTLREIYLEGWKNF